MLTNAYFLAKFRFDTAKNEPVESLQNFAKFCKILQDFAKFANLKGPFPFWAIIAWIAAACCIAAIWLDCAECAALGSRLRSEVNNSL